MPEEAPTTSAVRQGPCMLRRSLTDASGSSGACAESARLLCHFKAGCRAGGSRRPELRSPAVPRTVVVIPTYNERTNIARLVPQVLAATDCHVVVVDDDS